MVSPEHGFAFKTETGDVLNGTEATRITTSTFVWLLREPFKTVLAEFVR